MRLLIKKPLSWGFRMYCRMGYSHFLVYILYLRNVESIVKFWSVATFYTFMKGPHVVGKYVLIMVFVNKVPMLVLISESLVLWRLWSLKLLRTEKNILKHKNSWTHLSEINKCIFYQKIANVIFGHCLSSEDLNLHSLSFFFSNLCT